MKRDKSRDVREASAKYLRAVLESWPVEYVEENVATHIGNGLGRGLFDPSQKVRMECRAGFESLRRSYPNVWDSIVHKEGGIISRDMKLKRTLILAAEKSAEKTLREGIDDEEVSLGSRGSTASRDSSLMSNSMVGSRGSASASFVSFQSGGGMSYHSQRTAGSRSRTHRPRHGDAGASVASGSSKGRTGSVGRHMGRSLKSSSAVGGSSRIQPPSAKASAIPSPSRAKNEYNAPTSRSEEDEEARIRAAIAIQAAARGASTRKSILSKPEDNEETAKDSDTLEMIKSARKAVRLGITAEQMSVRRRSNASNGAHIVPPTPPSPTTGDSHTADFASPTNGERRHGRLSPGRELVIDRNGVPTPSPLSSSRGPYHDVQHDRIAEEEEEGDGGARFPKEREKVRKNSIVLQKRLKKISENHSARNLDDDLTDASAKPEYVLVGQELLEAHRHHVDELMNTLRMEMDVIRDFEKLIMSSDGAVNGSFRGSAGRRHPTEEDVLDYFESAALCLDKRSKAGDELRKAMDRISRGNDNPEVVPMDGESKAPGGTNGISGTSETGRRVLFP